MSEIIPRCIFCKVLNFLTLFLETFRRDLLFFAKLLLVNIILLKDYFLNLNVCEQFARNVQKFPKKWALMSEDSNWSFKDVDEYSNTVANFFSGEGLEARDEVAVFMESTPEEVMIMLGFAKIGVISAVINEHLKLDALEHSISCIDAKAIVFDTEMKSEMCEVYPFLSQKYPNLKYYILGSSEGCTMKVTELKKKLDTQISVSTIIKHKVKYSDKLCYLYTSGTTGLPKASIIRHSRFNFGIKMRNIFVGVRSDDTFYNTLPLHHVMGFVMGAGSALISGQTVVMRKKFSASNFWKDCLRYQCTIAGYIGEMTRYLLAQPPHDRDRDHKVRKMFGIGLRENISKELRERFRIENTYEFYGSTEGNVTLVNTDNKDGSCGFLPVIIPQFIRNRLLPIALLKVNEETGELLRRENEDVSSKPGESGMLAGRIFRRNPLYAFDGYNDKEETQKRIVCDVFVQGDRYFMSGDLFTMDAYGYLYFKDRLGDTFRWKGENVSTTQVETLISKELDGIDCVVYGVEVPNTEGRAGMVAIKDTKIDMAKIYSKFFKVLPYYAVPIFIRLVEHIEMTNTFKYKKIQLRNEGFDINVVKDPLFVFNSANRSYDKIDTNVYDDILNNRIQL